MDRQRWIDWYRSAVEVGATGIPHDVVSSLLANLGDVAGLNVLIETGTAFGANIINLKDDFDELLTVELSSSHYTAAMEALLPYPNVRVVCGSSAHWVPGIIVHGYPNRPVLFFLDAHYSGGDTAKDSSLEHPNCPLVNELREIGLRIVPGTVVVCDDYRLFFGSPYHEEGYPSLRTVQRVVRELYPADYDTYTIGDQVVIAPRTVWQKFQEAL